MKTHCLMLTLVLFAYASLSGNRLAAGQSQGNVATGEVSLRFLVSLTSPLESRVAVIAVLDGLDPELERLRFTMQKRFAFIRLPEPLLDGPIRATAGGTPLEVERRGPYEWEVNVGGHPTIRVEYVVPLTHRDIEAVKQRDQYEYPYIADDHGLLVSPTMFVFPEGVTPTRLRVRFELPEDWGVIAPWRSVGKREFDPGSREALLNDLIAVGAWNVHTIRVGRFVGTMAFAPGQDALEKAAVEPIGRIVESELALFGREAEGRYLFIFGRPEVPGLAGSPKTRSMTLSVEPRLVAMASRHLAHLIAHEFFHTWAADMEMPDELRWVNEGFTDYYAYLVAARVELNTWEDFANTLAEKMQSCAVNPKRGELSLAGAGGDVFFNDKDAYRLVYDGGLLIAAWLDQTIRRQGHGKTLDDLMRAFTNDPRWVKRAAAPTLKDLLAVAKRFTDDATAATLERYVSQPYDFDPVTALAALGVETRREVSPPNMGLRANLDGTRVVDMDHSALTYRVGVREGDRLIEVNGRSVADADEVHAAWRQPAENRIRVTLERGGQEIKIDQPVPQVEQFVVPVGPWRLTIVD